MDQNVKAVFIDLGGTLRMCHRVPAYEYKAKVMLSKLVKDAPSCDIPCSKEPDELFALIEERYKPYRDEIFATNREANDYDLWNKWLLPEMDTAYLAERKHDLSYWYRQCSGLRCITEGGYELMRVLHECGYKLGIISNLIGENEIEDFVNDYHLDRYFDDIVVSARCGLRKPGREIYLLAAERLGVPVENCISIADNLDRDITGAKDAGIYKNILLISKEKLAKKADSITDANRPDYIVHSLTDILNLDLFEGIFDC